MLAETLENCLPGLQLLGPTASFLGLWSLPRSERQQPLPQLLPQGPSLTFLLLPLSQGPGDSPYLRSSDWHREFICIVSFLFPYNPRHRFWGAGRNPLEGRYSANHGLTRRVILFGFCWLRWKDQGLATAAMWPARNGRVHPFLRALVEQSICHPALVPMTCCVLCSVAQRCLSL